MKHISRKNIAALLVLMGITVWFCCACGKNDDSSPSDSVNQAFDPQASQPSTTHAAASEISQEKPSSDTETGTNASGLHFLCMDDGENACFDNNGYYYLNNDQIKLNDGSYGTHLMYMDFASCQEIYLCSSPGCGHDTQDCTAVLPGTEFFPYLTKLFLFGDHLFALCLRPEYVAQASTEFTSSLSGGSTTDSSPSVLYRMNPDGTGREKVYEFASSLTPEGTLAADKDGLYIIAKKLSSEKTDTGSHTFASERSLIHLNLSSFQAETVCSLDFGDDISWRMIGCAQGSILLRGTDYGHKLTDEENDDDDQYKILFKNSHEVFALLEPSSKNLRELCRISNDRILSAAVMNDILYISRENENEIIGIDTASGKQQTIASLPQTNIWDTLDDVLCCTNWDASDHTYHFVNVKTGEVFHSGLVNKSLGWRLTFKAQANQDVLVVYDYDAAPSQLNEGGYDIFREIYGLISREDLFAGKENYRTIQAAEGGF